MEIIRYHYKTEYFFNYIKFEFSKNIILGYIKTAVFKYVPSHQIIYMRILTIYYSKVARCDTNSNEKPTWPFIMCIIE